MFLAGHQSSEQEFSFIFVAYSSVTKALIIRPHPNQEWSSASAVWTSAARKCKDINSEYNIFMLIEYVKRKHCLWVQIIGILAQE